MFQEMWERGLQWDEELPPDLTRKWQQWCSELPQLHQVSIPRWYKTHMPQQNSQELKLHIFCDSSERASVAGQRLAGRKARYALRCVMGVRERRHGHSSFGQPIWRIYFSVAAPSHCSQIKNEIKNLHQRQRQHLPLTIQNITELPNEN